MDSVGVGDVLRLFFENGHAHYLVTSVNFENEIMVRGKDGVEELLPVQKGVLSAFDGRAVVGLHILRPPAADYPKGSEVALDLTSGKRLRGTVQANEDGVLEITVPDQPAPIFVDSRAPHPLVARLAPYAEKEKEEVADLAKTAKIPVEHFKALRAEYTNAAGVRARPPLLTTTATLPRWILPLQRRYVALLVGGDSSARARGVTDAQFFDELAADPFHALRPFVPQKTDSSREALEPVQGLCLARPVVRGAAAVYFQVFAPPVAGEGAEPFEFDEFAVIPEGAPMSRAYLPATRLYDRCLLHPHLGRFDRLLRRKAQSARTEPDLARLTPTAVVKPSVHETLLTLEPYLYYPRDATDAVLGLLLPKIESKVAQIKARHTARTAATPSSVPASVFPDKYGFPLGFSSEILARMLRADYGRRLLNRPVRPAAPGKKAPAHTALEVLPAEAVEQFNAYLPLFGRLGKRAAGRAVALVDGLAREAAKGENAGWLYFREDPRPFMPVVVERLFRAYHARGKTGYLAALEQLKASNRVALEDNRYVDKGSGFVLAPVAPTAEEGRPLEEERPAPAYTQTDMAILAVLKTVAPKQIADRFDYIVQHVRGIYRAEDVVFSLCAYAALFAQTGAEEVAAAVVDALKDLPRGPFWESVRRFGQIALQTKIEEKIKFLSRDYEFVRLNRQAEVQKGREWPGFLPATAPRQNPVTPEDKVYLFSAQLPRLEASQERQDKIRFLEGAPKVRGAPAASLASPPPPAPKVAAAPFDEPDEEEKPPNPPADPKAAALDSEALWRCQKKKGPAPPDFADYLLDGRKVGPELLFEFVQNVALVYPTLVATGRAHFAAHSVLNVREDRVVAQRLSSRAVARLEKSLNDYYAPLFALPTSDSAQAYFSKRARGRMLGDNELSDHDAATTFVRTYLARKEEFRKVVERARGGDAKECLGRALALHLSATPLDYECAFVGACVRMFEADVKSFLSSAPASA